MIKVLFFASVRERLGVDSLELATADDVAAARVAIGRILGEGKAEVLAETNTLIAVNQQLAAPEQPLCDGDELAFFPPVTGG